MSNPTPTDNIHGQVQINQNNHRKCPKVSYTWCINCACPICKVRDKIDNSTLPQGVNHCRPEQFRVVALLPMPSSIKLWIP